MKSEINPISRYDSRCLILRDHPDNCFLVLNKTRLIIARTKNQLLLRHYSFLLSNNQTIITNDTSDIITYYPEERNENDSL